MDRLRVLVVEDSEDDCLLLLNELRRGGYEVTHSQVETAAGMHEALNEEWDLVLADFRLPNFSAESALAVLQDRQRDLPFIIVSGVIEDQEAVRMLKHGAHDFLPKSNLARLIPSVERELREADNRRRRRDSEERARRLAAIVECSEDAIMSCDLAGAVTSWNRAAEAMFGYAVDEIKGQSLVRLFPDDRAVEFEDILRQLRAGERLLHDETRLRGKGLTSIDVSLAISPLYDGEARLSGMALSARDITKRAEQQRLLEVRARQLHLLATAGERALHATHVDQIVEESIAMIVRGLRIDYVNLWELLPDGTSLLLRAGHGWRAGWVGKVRVNVDEESQAGYTLLKGAPVILEDIRAERRFRIPPLLQEHEILSGISVVVATAAGVPFGVLAAHGTRPRCFSPDDISFLQSLATIVGGAIARHRSEEALRRIHGELELRVQERTQELQSANQRLQEYVEELEQFHDLTVDRELRMMDVEKENEQLRQELERLSSPVHSRPHAPGVDG